VLGIRVTMGNGFSSFDFLMLGIEKFSGFRVDFFRA